jgi:dTDP-4-amino-4,6-dideoxygalactose transaminase
MQPDPEILFNSPAIMGRELELVQEAIGRGQLSGDGYFTHLCQERLKQLLGADKVLLTTSCTAALEMSALLLDIRPGDEVIVPSFTFVSGANAFVLRGAKPIFVDIRPDTLNLNEELIQKRVSSRTTAIVLVHYAGVACHIEPLLSIANRNGIPMVSKIVPMDCSAPTKDAPYTSAVFAATLTVAHAAGNPTFAIVPKSLSVAFYADVERGCKEEGA